MLGLYDINISIDNEVLARYDVSMPQTLGLAGIAKLFSDSSRASMLSALMSNHALTAGELARAAQISPQTASAHLQQLLAGGLLRVVSSGRHRYYKLAGADVANALEALSTLAPPAAPRNFREGKEAVNLRFARTCYDHLAGRLGVLVAQQLVEMDVVQLNDRDYQVSEGGKLWFKGWDINIEELHLQRRSFAKACLDWSERQFHIAGAVGAAMTNQMLSRKWLTRRGRGRALRLTTLGRQGFIKEFGLDQDALTPESLYPGSR